MLVRILFAASLVAHGQAFEVATIKPSNGSGAIRAAGSGRLSLSGMTLLDLTHFAYGTDFGNVVVTGGPRWMNDSSVRFDLEAQGSEAKTPADAKRMLQTLLTERFALKLHRETKDAPGYGLALVRSDGKPGPNMVDVTGKPCEDPTTTSVGAPRCGSRISPFDGLRLFAGRMEHLADLLSNPVFQLGRPVVDRSGLAGEFDVTLNFVLLVQKPDGGNTAADLVNGPSLATALREQLGLKLEPMRVETVTLVVDSAEKPGEN